MKFRKNKTAMIIGCSRFGANMGGTLSKDGYNTIVVDKDSSSFRKLPESFSGYQIQGDASDIETLKRLGIENVDLLISTTQNDNVNSLICQIADHFFHVPHIYMRLNDPEKEQLLAGFNIIPIEPFALSIAEFERLNSQHSEKESVFNSLRT